MHKHANGLPSKIALWGAVGQAKLMGEVISFHGSRIVAVFEDNPDFPPPFPDVPVYNGWDRFLEWVETRDTSDLGFCLGLNRNGRGRLGLHGKLIQLGLRPVTLVHPSAIIAENAEIGEGAQIMAGVIIGPEAKIGKQCIINTRASIDHENVLEDGVEISPGVTLCGMVRVGSCAWIAAGATVLPLVQIGRYATVGAGAVVTKNVPDGTTVVGIPAKPLAR